MSAKSARELLSGGYDSEYPEDFPPREFHVTEHDITETQADKLSSLVENNVGETDIDKGFIRDNPAIWTGALSWHRTGHHGAWVLSQQILKPRFSSVSPGMVPDYIIGGKHSGGFFWYVVELKGPNQQMFAGGGTDLRLSSKLNRGVCQTLRYIDYASEIQQHLRDQMGLTDFREPRGMILMGRKAELEKYEQRRSLRSAINRVTNKDLTIRTFDALVAEVKTAATY